MKMTKSKIAIVCGWDANYSDLAEVTIPNRERYCVRHGYELIAKLVPKVEQNQPWFKVAMVSEFSPRYDWIWLLDVDAMITNSAIKVESFLDTTADIIVGSDWNGLNAGSVFI